MSTGPTPHRAEEAPACLDLRALLVPRHQIHADLTAIPPRLAGVLPAPQAVCVGPFALSCSCLLFDGFGKCRGELHGPCAFPGGFARL